MKRVNTLHAALLGATCWALCAVSAARSPAAGADLPLRVYFIDVEGGQATLFVTPAHESLLIDTGWAGHAARDAKRIVQAARRAGVQRLDYVLLTHYHIDHAGGAAQLLARIPVGTFVDHGPNREPGDADTEHSWQEYLRLVKSRVPRLIVKPGQRLPLKGAEVSVISADGDLIEHPLDGAGGTNAFCTGVAPYAGDDTENARSLGVLVRFGHLRLLDLGDLTLAKEQALMCPVNKLGKIDVYIVSHHGWNQSNSPVLLSGLAPRIAIMDNGATKGGSPSVIDGLLHTSGAEALWQLHFSVEGGPQHNTAPAHIANLPGADTGAFLLLAGHEDGRVEVLNSRTGHRQLYPAP